MKCIILLLGVFACVQNAVSFEPGVRVRFDMDVNPGTTFFISIPRTASEAVTEGWTKVKRPRGHLPQLVLYCPSDRVVCALYDDTDYIAGLQVALAKDELTESTFDLIAQGYTSWTTKIDGHCKSFWTLQQYFVSEEFLQKSKEDRLASRDDTKILQDGGVWLTGNNKEILKVSNSAADIGAEDSLFTLQACIPWMGRHYYYNMTTSTECTTEGIYPWFPMVHSGELIATGFLTSGHLPIKEGVRDWFERPDSTVVKAIVPDGPECIYEMADEPGLITMHIYYIDTPWLIDCEGQ